MKKKTFFIALILSAGSLPFVTGAQIYTSTSTDQTSTSSNMTLLQMLTGTTTNTTTSAPISTTSATSQVQGTSTSSAIPLCEIFRTLRLGSRGEDVSCLQRYLNWTGIPVPNTGYFGQMTRNALGQWQKSNTIPVNGIFNLNSFNRYVQIVRVALGVTN